MKIFCLIFAVFVFTLSVMPCCSDDNCINEQEQTAGNSQNSDDCTSCSPFYMCCAGSGFIFSNSQFSFSKIVPYKEKHTSTYKAQFVNSFVVKIWQPPKLV